MASVTFEQLTGLMAVALILIGAYNTIMTAMKNHREEKKLRESPVTTLKERVDRHDELFKKDEDRLDRLEANAADIGMAIRVLLRQSMAVNQHLISGNDVDRLKESNSEIQEYLTNRK